MTDDDRIADLEGALDDAMAEIARLRRWRERAWEYVREQLGRDAIDAFAALEDDRPAGTAPAADERARVDPETARRVIAEAEMSQFGPVDNPVDSQ